MAHPFTSMSRRTRGPELAAIALAALLCGCALKSPPTREDLVAQTSPNMKLPEQWQATGAVAGEVADNWLTNFNDAQLKALVQEALAYNYDLQTAASRVEQAAAAQRMAGGLLYPQVSVLGRKGGQMSGDSSGMQGLGLFINWELDLWGRVRAGAASADAQFDSAVLDAYYARQSIAAQVAKGWFLATEARMQKDLAERTLRDSAHLTSLAQDRFRVGIGDEYDVAQSRADQERLKDTERSLDQALQQAVRSLEILVGRYPGAQLAVPAELGPVPPPIPAGVPSSLLERRPDVVAAERRVAVAMYRTEQAKAARLPTLSLTGMFGTISSDLFVLKDIDNPLWSAGVGLAAPLFTGGQLQGQVELRTAEETQAMANYGRIGARGFGEVENALTAVSTLDQRAQFLRQSVVENERAVMLAGERYKVGSTDMRALLQQTLALYSAQSTHIHVRTERLVQRVNLHLALGGNFEQPATAQAQAQPEAAPKTP